MTTDQIGRALVAVLGVTTVLCLLPIIVVQVIEYVRWFKNGDGLGPYRIATASIFLCAATILTWRLAIWLDVTLAGQTWLGPTMERWRLDLTVGAICQILAVYPAWIFWRDRWRVRQLRRAKEASPST